MVRHVVVVAACAFALLSLASAKDTSASGSDADASNHLDADIVLDGDHAGGSGGQGDFSSGSGLREIAQGSAQEANDAFFNQHLAARQAAYNAKNNLAQAAAGASATARASLVGKYNLVVFLQRELQDAHQQLEAETQQLEQVERAAASAHDTAQLAQLQMNAVGAAANAAQGGSARATDAAGAAAVEYGSQEAMVGAAKRRLVALLVQLDAARVDLEGTQAAAQQASDAALIARSNAAQASEKASVSSGSGGLGEIHVAGDHH